MTHSASKQFNSVFTGCIDTYNNGYFGHKSGRWVGFGFQFRPQIKSSSKTLRNFSADFDKICVLFFATTGIMEQTKSLTECSFIQSIPSKYKWSLVET